MRGGGHAMRSGLPFACLLHFLLLVHFCFPVQSNCQHLLTFLVACIRRAEIGSKRIKPLA
jgi:hypothetical protein